MTIKEAILVARAQCAALPDPDDALSRNDQKARYAAQRLAFSRQVTLEQGSHSLTQIEAKLATLRAEEARWTQVYARLNADLERARAARDVRAERLLEDSLAKIQSGWENEIPTPLWEALLAAGFTWESARRPYFFECRIAELVAEKTALEAQTTEIIAQVAALQAAAPGA